MSQASIFLNKPTKSLYDRPQSSPPPHPLPMMSAILFTLLQHQFALILHITFYCLCTSAHTFPTSGMPFAVFFIRLMFVHPLRHFLEVFSDTISLLHHCAV